MALDRSYDDDELSLINSSLKGPRYVFLVESHKAGTSCVASLTRPVWSRIGNPLGSQWISRNLWTGLSIVGLNLRFFDMRWALRIGSSNHSVRFNFFFIHKSFLKLNLYKKIAKITKESITKKRNANKEGDMINTIIITVQSKTWMRGEIAELPI